MKPKIHVLYVPGADPQRDSIVARLAQEGDACIHTDPERKGVMQNWLTALRCAEMHDRDLPWSVIVQDDAEPLRNWQYHLPMALDHSPSPILGLTHFGKFGTVPLEHGAPYGIGPHMVTGGAIGYRRDIVRPLLAWSLNAHARTGYKHDDWMITAYAVAHDLTTAMTSRAIFGQPVKKSLLNHNTKIRTPFTTIENIDGPDWDAAPKCWPVRRPVPQSAQLVAEVVGR